MWEPIEDLRNDSDYIDLKGHDSEMYLSTAFRLLDEGFTKTSDSGYKELVKHCLNVPWVTSTVSAVSAKMGNTERQEEIIWEGVYNDVIVPLERDISMALSSI